MSARIKVPKPREAPKFEYLIGGVDFFKDRYFNEAYKKYLIAKHSSENYDFLMRMYKLQKTDKLTPKELDDALRGVYDKYIKVGSTDQINLPEPLVNALKIKVESGQMLELSDFGESVANIIDMLRKNDEASFLTSKEYARDYLYTNFFEIPGVQEKIPIKLKAKIVEIVERIGKMHGKGGFTSDMIEKEVGSLKEMLRKIAISLYVDKRTSPQNRRELERSFKSLGIEGNEAVETILASHPNVNKVLKSKNLAKIKNPEERRRFLRKEILALYRNKATSAETRAILEKAFPYMSIELGVTPMQYFAKRMKSAFGEDIMEKIHKEGSRVFSTNAQNALGLTSECMPKLSRDFIESWDPKDTDSPEKVNRIFQEIDKGLMNEEWHRYWNEQRQKLIGNPPVDKTGKQLTVDEIDVAIANAQTDVLFGYRFQIIAELTERQLDIVFKNKDPGKQREITQEMNKLRQSNIEHRKTQQENVKQNLAYRNSLQEILFKIQAIKPPPQHMPVLQRALENEFRKALTFTSEADIKRSKEALRSTISRIADNQPSTSSAKPEIMGLLKDLRLPAGVAREREPKPIDPKPTMLLSLGARRLSVREGSSSLIAAASRTPSHDPMSTGSRPGKRKP